jgi:hypothetical protein
MFCVFGMMLKGCVNRIYDISLFVIDQLRVHVGTVHVFKIYMYIYLLPSYSPSN